MEPPINGLPLGHHVLGSVHHQVSNLSFGTGGSDHIIFKGSPAHVGAPFEARAPDPVSGQLSVTRPPGGAAIAGPGFLSAFAHRHSLLGHPVPARDFRSPHGRPTEPPADGRTLSGFSVFRTHETRPGWVPSLPRGGGVLPTSAASLIGACHFTTASPLPRCNLPPAELLITEHTKIHSRSPVRPFPCPSFPGGTGTLRLSPGLRTPRSPTTHARAGTVHRTLDRITSSSSDDLQSA